MQHQSLAVIMDALAQAFPHMPESWKDRVERIVLNSLAALGDHVPTRLIEASLGRMVAALDRAGRCATAARVKAAAYALQSTSGTINARGNRA